MSDFRTRRIHSKPPVRPFKMLKSAMGWCFGFIGRATKKQWSYAMGVVLIFLASIIVFKVSVGIYNFIGNFKPQSLVFALGSELKQDANGYTNIVLLGDGGHERDGADLEDTIIVASLDFKNKTVSMLSVPRDFYVKTADFGSSKINEMYRDNKKKLGEVEGYKVYQSILGDITGLDIPYFIRVDFNAFVDIVDSLGGITVDVKEPIYDPYYPNSTDNGYTVFQMDAGLQEMDGETALKFSRSRKTTSDFSRSARQQQVLMAIKEKALAGGKINSGTISKMYSAISKNMNTNMSLRDLITLGSFAKDFDQSRMISKVLHDDPSREGGFLYTPERQYYNGMFVLVPDGDNYDLIRKYSDLIFNKRDVLINPVKIEVLNGTKNQGVARSAASYLNRFGFNVVNIDNLTDKSGQKKYVDKTFIRYNSWDVADDGSIIAHHQSTLDALSAFINGEPIPNDEQNLNAESPDISVVLGLDYKLL